MIKSFWSEIRLFAAQLLLELWFWVVPNGEFKNEFCAATIPALNHENSRMEVALKARKKWKQMSPTRLPGEPE